MWALLLLTTAVSAETLVEGDQIRVYYNDYGTWNGDSSGFQIGSSSEWRDVCFPGSPWQQISFEWDQGGSSHSYGGNRSSGSWGWTMDETVDTSTSEFKEIIHRWTMGDLQVTKSEAWPAADNQVLITFFVTNNGSSDATNLRIMHAVDPDQDANAFGTYDTLNDVRSDGRYLEMVGPTSGWSFAYGLCDPDDELGITGWDSDADATLTDPDGASQDNTGHWRHTETIIGAGESISASFVVSWATSADLAEANYDANYALICGLCDSDGDGYDSTDDDCGGDDCDDTNADINPGATEYCDGFDNDCDGTVDGSSAVDAISVYADADGDGYGDEESIACSVEDGYAASGGDCNDDNFAIYPGADELCDGEDNDCDGAIDEDGAVDAPVWYTDADGDGFGDSTSAVYTCSMEDGTVADDTDCDDSSSSIYPGADEYCNGIDDNCDLTIDEDAVDAPIWYADSDADGYGDASSTSIECTAPDGFITDDSDCDDSRADVNPGATETCNGIDDDCDGSTDEAGATGESTWYIDYDGDAYGSSAYTTEACDLPSGYADNPDDCDDFADDAYPGALEVCDGADNDCDGTIDESDAEGAGTWYVDADGDGFGDPGVDPTMACEPPEGTTDDATDCDDSRADVSPGAPEVCDEVDNDCDGTVDEDEATDAATWYRDVDGDGYGDEDDSAPACTEPEGFTAMSGDCDLDNPDIYPGASETCNETDDDCDGEVDEEAIDAPSWYIDYDTDGHGAAAYSIEACEEPEGYVSLDDDCDDTRPTVYPGATEFCDGYDNDCDGETDEDDADDLSEWYADIDHDGYADEETTTWACDEPGDHISAEESLGWDCDDYDASIHPDAEEVWYDDIDQDCGGDSDWDADGDGYDLIDDTSDTADMSDTGGPMDMSDCDDEDPDVYPGAEEIWYDGIDGDCDEASDYDADGDGYDSASYEGDDCDDADPETYPGAPDEPGDGIVTDCDEADEYDADGDGFDSAESGGDDCDDANGDINPDAEDIPDDGIDQDCDGVDATEEDTGEPEDTGEDTDEPGDDDTGGATPGGGDDDGSTDTGEASGLYPPGDKEGCGCATGGGAGGMLLPLVMLGLARRRRN